MKVAIAKKLLSSVGGSELQARLLARALAARGHDVLLVGMRPAWPRPGIPDRAVLRGGGGTVRDEADGVAFAYIAARGGRAGAAVDGLFPTDLADESALTTALRGRDVVHVIAREWAGSYERAARRAGGAVVETPLVHPGQPFSGAAGADVARYRRDDAVIALTEWEAGWYRERGVERVRVTGVGPVIGDVPCVDADAATILFVGRKERYKGYHALRAAAPLVWRERPDARFVAIGQRAWRDRPVAVDPRWIDLGVVDEAAKTEAYARATVLVMPSEHETFGHTYLEAWAAGRPVIAGDIPPLREVVRDGVDGLHARNDPVEVARAILRILGDPAAARRMGEAGRERLRERWTWERIAERTEKVYEEAVARGA
ncbi:MAG: glycosyltransferase family 4 protein [Chloroflexota bacterium]|nr:glycosyltransferase family 4 protein [Chloroflexota bacterium]